MTDPISNQLVYRRELRPGKTKRKTVYKIIYSRLFSLQKAAVRLLRIKVRPAGLEPATPSLEGRFGQRINNPNCLGKLGFYIQADTGEL